jgi:Calcineurin-like phosphoesterase.
MKLRILSDLHLECFAEPEDCGIRDDIGCDAVVLAGDIHNGTIGIEWAARTFSEPVIYVMGNHEYYHHDAAELLARARECAADLGVHLLERDEVRIKGTRFLGCTLWTGFDAGPIGWTHAARIAHSIVADFSEMRNGERLVSPSQMVEWYEYSLGWLTRRLNAKDPAVVITHFVPSLAVTNPLFGAGDELTPYFHCDLEHLMGAAVPLWIYGHNHYSANETIRTSRGATQVFSNQLGYPDEHGPFQIDRVVIV